MSTDEHIQRLLQVSMRHLNDATDPNTPEACFRPYLTIGAVAAQAAYLLSVLAVHLPAEAVEVIASEMDELAVDGEVLVSWVGQELNRDHQ